MSEIGVWTKTLGYFRRDPAGHGYAWLARDALDDRLTLKSIHRRVLPSASQQPLSHAHLTYNSPAPSLASLLASLSNPLLAPRARPYCLTSDFFHLGISSAPWLVRNRIHDSPRVSARKRAWCGLVPSSSKSCRPRSPRFESPSTLRARTMPLPCARLRILRLVQRRHGAAGLGHSDCAADLPCTSNPPFPKDLFLPS